MSVPIISLPDITFLIDSTIKYFSYNNYSMKIKENIKRQIFSVIEKSNGSTIGLSGWDSFFLEETALDIIRADPQWDKTKETADLMIIKADDGNIGIDEAHEITHFLTHKPFKGDRKYVYIKNPEQLTREAANSLLKTFEETQHNTTIIMTSTSWNSVITTIRSRTMIFEVPYPLNLLEELKKQYRNNVKHIYAACNEDYSLLKYSLENDLSSEMEAFQEIEKLRWNDLLDGLANTNEYEPLSKLKKRKIIAYIIRTVADDIEPAFFEKYNDLKGKITDSENAFSLYGFFSKVIKSMLRDALIINNSTQWYRVFNLDLIEWFISRDTKQIKPEDFNWCDKISRLKIRSLNSDLVLFKILYIAHSNLVSKNESFKEGNYA
jgi:DNA polymerase III delta prime subunit